MNESLDDLAAFLMHRTSDQELTEVQRLEIYTVVSAYQEGDDPADVEAALRTAGAMFADHRDYDQRWRPADRS